MYEDLIKIKNVIEEELKFDDENLHEFIQKLPARRAFWVGKFIEAKIKLSKIEEAKKELISNSDVKLNIGMSKKAVTNSLSINPKIQELNNKEKELKLIVEYLEKILVVYNQATYVIQAKVELKKLEER